MDPKNRRVCVSTPQSAKPRDVRSLRLNCRCPVLLHAFLHPPPFFILHPINHTSSSSVQHIFLLFLYFKDAIPFARRSRSLRPAVPTDYGPAALPSDRVSLLRSLLHTTSRVQTRDNVLTAHQLNILVLPIHDTGPLRFVNNHFFSRLVQTGPDHWV